MKTVIVFVGLLLLLFVASPFVEASPLPDVATTGTISGTVTNAVSGVGIPWVQIQIFLVDPPGSNSWVQVLTDLSGNYHVTLDPGTYILHAQPPYVSGSPYVAEWYDDTDSAHATPVVLGGGASVVANFALNRQSPSGAKGEITGDVKADDTGLPLANVVLHFTNLALPSATQPNAVTDANGHYAATLDVGPYFIKATPPSGSGYASAWYNGVSDPLKATSVAVEEGKSSTADFSLIKLSAPPTGKGEIQGTVLDKATNSPVPLVSIRFFHPNTKVDCWQGTVTDMNGSYRADLAPGSYLVEAVPIPKSGYAIQWFENATDPASATMVEVVENGTSTANFALAKSPTPELFTVGGVVMNASGDPLAHASVAIVRTLQDMNALFTSSGSLRAFAEEIANIAGVGECLGVVWLGSTDSAGQYQASVPGGNSYYAFATAHGYLPQFYNKKSGPLDADPILVEANVTGIDFALESIPAAANSISGQVMDEQGGGVKSRIVLVSLPLTHAGLHNRFGLTDSAGRYTLADVASGKYLVLALPFDGYAPTFYKLGTYGVIGWQKADTVEIDGVVSDINIGVVPIHLKGIAHLFGKILSHAGQPLEAVRVVGLDVNGDVIGCGFTDSQGSYTLDMIPSGSIDVVTDLEEYTSSTVPVEVGAETYSLNVSDIAMVPVLTTSAGKDPPALPNAYVLYQNYPNPFNPSTTIDIDLPVASRVSLSVYNLLGQEVKSLVDGVLPSGRTRVVWDGKDNRGNSMSTGVY
ncbi:MAG: carboxypeptidase regulatory-like domain-containing protein, partial [Bacteroidota bacterium]